MKFAPRRFSVLLALLIGAGLFAGCERYAPPAQRVEVNNVTALRKSMGGDQASSTGSGAEQAPAAEPTGWATIRGTFRLDGPIPERTRLTVDKEQNICAPGGKQVFAEELVVDDATKGIKDVVIFLATKYPFGDPKWEHESYLATREAEVEFDQENCIFLSHMFVMQATQTCKVLNSDPIGHNTNIAGGGRANSGNFTVAGNSSAIYEPGGESPEPFQVACNIHPWMSARMLVRNSPYYAVTAPDGTFEIANVPAGVDLEFRVWQEKAGYIQNVSLNGAEVKWNRGRVNLTLEPDAEQAFDVVVKTEAFSR